MRTHWVLAVYLVLTAALASVASAADRPPRVLIKEPVENAELIGTVLLKAQAYDDNAVVNISFSLDGAQIGIDRDGTNGWWISWDSDEVGDGAHTLTVVATDSAGQTTLESISVAINNADLPPHVAVTSPSDGAVVSGTVTITADASDDRAITHVSFAVGGTMMEMSRSLLKM